MPSAVVSRAAAPAGAPDAPSFSPLYRQIAALITRSLQASEWKPGEAIPSELDLAARYKVSQGTVRKAIDDLATSNLLVRRQGKGTYVATHAEETTQFRFLRLAPDGAGATGEREPLSRRFLDCRRQRAPAEVARAIDLRGGRVVRLTKGDYDTETVYGDDPLSVAVSFAEAGAPWVHVVDLDAARSGDPVNRSVIAAIATVLGGRAKLQTGGGVRSVADAVASLQVGAGEPDAAEALLGERAHVRFGIPVDQQDALPARQQFDGRSDACDAGADHDRLGGVANHGSIPRLPIFPVSQITAKV